MTDILELAKQAGFLPEYIFNADDRFAKLASLLREKFIAELEQTNIVQMIRNSEETMNPPQGGGSALNGGLDAWLPIQTAPNAN